MVPVFVALTILALVALDYFVLRPRRVRHRPRGVPLGPEPLSPIVNRVPPGLFLQPTYTWSRIQADGELLVGVHPLLVGLVGAPCRIELLEAGCAVERGAPLIRLEQGGRHLTVRSPLAGRIAAVNPDLQGQTEWGPAADGNGSWCYRMQPRHLAEDVPRWMIAERAAEWTRRQYDRVRTHLTQAVRVGQVGVTMADGGDIPVGILSRLDAPAWETVQSLLDRDDA